MRAVEALFTSGRMIDAILVLVALEAAALWFYIRGGRRSFAFADVLWNLLAGACLLLALRAAIADAGWAWLAVFLALALIAHVADLRRRLRAR